MINMIKGEMNKHFKRSASLVLVSTVCVASIFSAGAFSRKVDINVDDNVISTITINNETHRILDQVGVEVSDKDKVIRHEELDGTLKLNVKRAFDVTISKGNKSINLKMAGGKVSDAIEDSGIELSENDISDLPLDMDLTPGIKINIFKRVKIFLNADGEIKEMLAPEGTVNDMLSFFNIPLSSQDIINIDVFSNIYEGMEIIINRITYRETIKTEDIPFNTVVKKTHLLDDSERKITSVGKNGKKEITLKETLMDGNVIDSEEIKSTVICEATDEVVLEGKKSSIELDEGTVNTPSSSNKNIISGSATAYTASSGSRTSTGSVPTQGVTIAVNPHVIPYGKKITVKSTDGKFICSGIAQDTGGALMSGTAVVDIYMNNKSDCIKFGRKKVNVYY